VEIWGAITGAVMACDIQAYLKLVYLETRTIELRVLRVLCVLRDCVAG